MKSHFPASFFKHNRQWLQTSLQADYPIVLTANGLLQKSTDTAFAFQQDGSFWYLSGVDEPNVLLVIDGDKDYLIIPELSASREAFDGAIDADALQARSGVGEVLLASEGWERLNQQLKATTQVGTLLPADNFIEALGMYTNPARAQLVERLKTANNKLDLQDVRQVIGKLRMVKQPLEQAAIQKAIAITAAGIDAVYAQFQEAVYKNEFDIELALTRAFHQDGGNGHSFEPIVAGGAKAATIHPTGNVHDIDYHTGMLLDVGAEFSHYAADISRTWVPEGNDRYQAVYQAVKDTADYAMTLLKPGIKLREYEQAIEARMGEELLKLGLIKAAEHEAIRKYFPHSTSHFLGIDVHDSGDYDEALSEGVVLTVEPGIYIPEEGIGVRIEDDVLITKDGCTNLSAKLRR
jgi:Xaa-Pro aminopeptidase